MTPSACSCREFTRAEALRGAVATAGQGLPAIEPGMPVPAGTGLSRRSFLARSAGLGLAVFGASALSPEAFEHGIAAARAATPGRVLVSIYLPGGLDAMSLLAPVGHSRYRALRPSLGYPDDPALRFGEDPSLQWHPAATGLRDLHARGRVSVVPGVGYTDPNQSHFTSRHYWEVGALDPAGRVGWMGRFLDRHGVADNPLQGLSIDYSLAPSLATARHPVAAVATPESYSFWTRDVWDSRVEPGLFDAFRALGALPTDDPGLLAARRATAMTGQLRSALGPIQDVSVLEQTRVPYPQTEDGFPRRLAALAEMLELGMPLRCVAIPGNGGYDTHDNQAASLDADIGLLSRSLAAFQADLEARGLADRVVTHVWSEFGRRAQENGAGTDHGAGGVSMLIGTKVGGTMVGAFGGLGTSQLDRDGNLRHDTDFRSIARTIVEDWMGESADGIVQSGPGVRHLDTLFR